jgi:hypothetical protein
VFPPPPSGSKRAVTRLSIPDGMILLGHLAIPESQSPGFGDSTIARSVTSFAKYCCKHHVPRQNQMRNNSRVPSGALVGTADGWQVRNAMQEVWMHQHSLIRMLDVGPIRSWNRSFAVGSVASAVSPQLRGGSLSGGLHILTICQSAAARGDRSKSECMLTRIRSPSALLVIHSGQTHVASTNPCLESGPTVFDTACGTELSEKPWCPG